MSMPLRKCSIGIVLLIIMVLISIPVIAASVDNVQRMTVQELKAKMDRGEDIVILDVRVGREYDRSPDKIKGAVRISIFQLNDRYRELPMDKEIVAYCT
jgi:hypothetical protein